MATVICYNEFADRQASRRGGTQTTLPQPFICDTYCEVRHMPARLPESGYVDRVNSRQNIQFIRWLDGFESNKSKAICRCLVDGHEWATSVSEIVNSGKGCPLCAISLRASKLRADPSERIKKIESGGKIKFVRWAGEYKNQNTRAVVRCIIDGFEWQASATSLINGGKGCPNCAKNRRWSADDRIAQINMRDGISFVRWGSAYHGKNSRAEVRCEKCGSNWVSSADSIINQSTGCPSCAGNTMLQQADVELRINSMEGVQFLSWVDGHYAGSMSRVVAKCDLGHEWESSSGNLLRGRRCPSCMKSGYDQTKKGYLYALKSKCGKMVKIGISNNLKRRLGRLKLATPFEWECVKVVCGHGSGIAKLEKKIHSITEQVAFDARFDGYTEWRAWDDRILEWIDFGL